jgi:hypothetical protein
MPAGKLFQSFMVLFTKEYLPTCVSHTLMCPHIGEEPLLHFLPTETSNSRRPTPYSSKSNVLETFKGVFIDSASGEGLLILSKFPQNTKVGVQNLSTLVFLI